MGKHASIVLRAMIFLVVVAIGVAAIFVIKAALAEKPKTPRTEVEREIMDAEAAVKSDPSSAKSRATLSLAYTRAGRYNDAIESASIAIKLDKTSATAYYALGIARSRQGNDDEAANALKKAISLHTTTNDTYQQAFYELGDIYMRQGNYKNAIAAYKGAVGNGPEATYAVIALANAYEKSGARNEAISEYRSVLDYDPSNQEAKQALQRLGVMLK